MSVTGDLKDVCNRIVGQWYSEETKEYFIFDLNDQLLRDARLVIIQGQKRIEKVYGIGVQMTADVYAPHQFYFTIGTYSKRYYNIVNLTKELLVINEYFMEPNVPPSPNLQILKRVIDLSAADTILGSLNMEE